MDGTARSRAHGGAMRSAWPWPDQGTETTTGDNSEGAKHANTEAVALSAVPCRSYQSVGMEASQLFQNWPQYGAATTPPSPALARPRPLLPYRGCAVRVGSAKIKNNKKNKKTHC